MSRARAVDPRRKRNLSLTDQEWDALKSLSVFADRPISSIVGRISLVVAGQIAGQPDADRKKSIAKSYDL